MTPEDLGRLLRDDEAQRVEFKKSLALTKDSAKAAVAFANARGGYILVGVEPSGALVGVAPGEFNRERFANDVESYVYPHLPLFIEGVPLQNGNLIVVVEVPADRPPLVGAYLLASRQLQPRETVAASMLQAYRRVGRTSQQVDFMWLRPQVPSDPRILVSLTGQTRAPVAPSQIGGVAWVDPGSGSAHDVRVRTEPAIYRGDYHVLVLPRSDGMTRMGFELRVDKSDLVQESFWLVSECRDDWGFAWEARRLVHLVAEGEMVAAVEGAQFERRIVKFPPKLTMKASD